MKKFLLSLMTVAFVSPLFADAVAPAAEMTTSTMSDTAKTPTPAKKKKKSMKKHASHSAKPAAPAENAPAKAQ